MLTIYKLYDWLYSLKKKIHKILVILCIGHDIYFIIQSLTNEGDVTFDIRILLMPWICFICYLILAKIFYSLIGQYWILRLNQWQTKEFQKNVMDKNIKASGKRRGYKDTIQSGMTSNFIICSKEQINEEIGRISVYLYRFDLKYIKDFIKENMQLFNVASKRKKKENYMLALANHDLFLKKKYLPERDDIMNDFKENGKQMLVVKSKYIISDGVSFNHIMMLLYNYMYMLWRLEADIWVIANQPALQSYDYKNRKAVPARIYSPDLKSTKNRTIKTKDGNKIIEYLAVNYMLAEDWICFWETESDVWWNNIEKSVKDNILERGIRWFEVAQGHIMGEHAMSLRNGQVAGRTIKIQRDLEESFYSVTRAVKIYGGSKRIFFLKLFMALSFPIIHFNPGIKARIYNHIEKLKMTGWLKLETVFSRSDQINYTAPAITLTKLLDKNDNLYMVQYQTTLVFKISQCWGRYNTHYLEYLADKLTADSKASLLDLPKWGIDLKLTKEAIAEMDYDTADVFDLSDEEKYRTEKYVKVEKPKKEAIRMDDEK